MFNALQRVTGFEVLGDLSDFVANFGGMYAGFGERAAKVEALLGADTSTFLLVCSPRARSVDEAVYFCAKLAEYRLGVGGFVVNRVHPDAFVEPAAREAWREVRMEIDAPTVQTFEWLQALAEVDRAEVERLERACPGPRFLRTVPAFARDIHDLAGLSRVNGYLF
jgi:anion-transporting  ArsA/GET3 family ATPase